MNIDDWRSQGQYFDLKGQRIFYRCTGKGTPIVMLHGFPSSSWDWHRVWPLLQPHYQLVAVDMLGLGFSDKPAIKYSVKLQCDMLEALLAYLDIDEFYLLSHDYGNSVGQELLARQLDGFNHQRILKFMMLNGAVFPECYKPLWSHRLLASFAGPMLTSSIRRRHVAKNMARLCHQPQGKDVVDGIWKAISANNGQRALARISHYIHESKIRRPRWVSALMNAPCPMRLLCGLHDPLAGQKMVDRYRQLILDGDCGVLVQAGYYPHLEVPLLLAKEIKAYFQNPQLMLDIDMRRVS